MDLPYLQYFEVLDSTNLKSDDIAVVQGWIESRINAVNTPRNFSGRVQVRDLPSARWGLDVAEQKVTIALRFADEEAIAACRAWLVQDYPARRFLGMGVDVPIAPFEAWIPGAGTGALFGGPAEALHAVGAAALAQAGMDGRSANIVVFDNGLCTSCFEHAAWNFPGTGVKPGSKVAADVIRRDGGWAPAKAPQGLSAIPKPWAAEPGHGTMVARNALRLAPRATLWDVPFLPPAIGDIQMFLSEAQACWRRVLTDKAVLFRSGGAGETGQWVFLNAWGIYDRRAEVTPLHPGDYTENRAPGSHPFNRIVEEAATQHGVDVVFAAGNAGPFAPHWRCGPQDRGAGRGIWGANAHRSVLSVGAVRSDGRLAGYSSWGPGPDDMQTTPLLSRLKPDLCAPSNFADAGSVMPFANTGTSAASGIAAGFVAAVRSQVNPELLAPASLQALLRETAWTPVVPPDQPYLAGATRYDPGMGWGILCGERVVARLPPPP